MAKFGVLFEVVQYVLVEVEKEHEANARAEAECLSDEELIQAGKVVNKTTRLVHSYPLKGNR
jgi:hypothetical protein